MIRLYDARNYYRVLLERDITGLAPRTVLDQMNHLEEPAIWVWDGATGNKLRREIYPEYKLKRTPPSKDIFAGFKQMQEILKHTAVIQIEVPGYEADDVIAQIARHYADERIGIYSNDWDFAQLQAQFSGRIFIGAKQKTSVPDKLVRHYKALVGDSSDNIPGVKGFGQKTWDSLGEKAIENLMYDIIYDNPIEEMPGLSKMSHAWLQVAENRKLVHKFWDIVGFLEVPWELITKHMTVGRPNYAKADAILKEFML